MAIRFTDVQVLFIINKWKEDTLNKSISSNAVKLGNIQEEFNKEFGSSITKGPNKNIAKLVYTI